MTKFGECLWCEEPLHGGMSSTPIHTAEGLRYQHWECALRTVIGGIGHLIAHPHWCTQMHDPDAGLTKRQSAVLAAAWVKAVGFPSEPDASAPDAGREASQSQLRPERPGPRQEPC